MLLPNGNSGRLGESHLSHFGALARAEPYDPRERELDGHGSLHTARFLGVHTATLLPERQGVGSCGAGEAMAPDFTLGGELQ